MSQRSPLHEIAELEDAARRREPVREHRPTCGSGPAPAEDVNALLDALLGDDWNNKTGRTLRPCGTWAAYTRHKRRGEPACDACMDAMRSRNRRTMPSPIRITRGGRAVQS